MDSRHTHDVDQIRAALREMATVVAQHRADLIREGVPRDEAFALAQSVEARWSEVIFARYEQKHEARALEAVLDLIREEIRG